MDEHVSSTTANPESEIDKLTHDLGSGDSDTEVLEDNEALAKNHVDEDDLSEPEENERHIAAEDPPKETFLESPPGPEPQEVTEPEAPLPTYSAVADSTEEPTQSDTEDTTPEPEKEETIEPTTEDTIPQPETEATTVLPEPEDIIHRPDTPTEAPVSLPKESPASESAAPHEPIISSSAPSPPQPLSSAVVDLLYWRDIKTTGVVFGALLFLLLSLTVCSIVSVCSYVALALLSVSISFRIYKGILQAVQKSDEGHPFKVYLDQDVALPEDSVHQYSDLALERINVWIVELRRLFLVEDLVDSLKFAVGMWVLTYVGALFNGLTLLILVLIGVFSCPVIYEKNQKQIDHYVELVTGQVKDAFGKVQAKVPGLKRKSE
ncbi:reticulon-4-like isoform X2 [Conger conger]|uniref:reticulon-4-like isoform X2 n=1 Tax=Conger conger TaxID=82655 RepID=UPI002A599B62|nr:reticulon-4-like isoform X2 [Conger conger]